MKIPFLTISKTLPEKSLGFSLIEVLISLAIFSIGSIAVAKSFMNHLAQSRTVELRSNAFSAAQQVLDGLRVVDPSTLPTTGYGTAQNISIGGKTYVATVQYCRITSYCSSANVRFLTVSVTYRGALLYTVETIYSQLN